MSTRFFLNFKKQFICNFKKIASILLLIFYTSTASADNGEERISVPDDTTALMLNEVTVSAGIKSTRTSPLRLTSINAPEIQHKAVGKTYPELLKNIPGIYATEETGSYGDAKINIRGFKQENISVLLNGIPISGLTTGNMFWNNWLGLTDATSTIQVQKGIGGSMLSDNSVGGTINIVTKSPAVKSATEFGYSYTGYGLSKANVSFNSGDLGRGWAFILMGSYTWGNGFVECTDVKQGSYMFSLSKKFNEKHSLLFTALGGPERHQQRSQRLSYSEIEKYGVDYNKNWGYYTNEKGEQVKKTISENVYFKPYFTLNHYFTNNRKFKLNSAIYFSIGDGGGIWTESKGRKIISFQKDGHIDWDAVVANNRNSATQSQTPEGSAQNIMSDYMAGNLQIGATSTASIVLSDKWSLEAGLHYQHYTTWEKEQITDLLGGSYWYEDYAHNSLMGAAGRDPYKQVGDYIRTYNGKVLNYGTIFAMANYSSDRWIINIGGSLNGSTHQRWDRYNYSGDDVYSDVATGLGASFKTGILFKASKQSSFYINGAIYSRVPYSNVFFASGNNHISEDVKNERNLLGEIGYRFVYQNGGIEGTFYSAYWKNKSIMSSPYKNADEDAYKFMITGLDAFHYGVEIDAFHNFSRWLKATAFFAMGTWEWKNNVDAIIYDQYTGQISSEVHVYSDGLPVGDAPQTQIGASLVAHPFINIGAGAANWIRDFTIGINWQYNGRYWADFEPNTRTNSQDSMKPYRIPDYNLVDLTIGNTFHTKVADINLFFNLNNLLDESYIVRGKDGASHTAESFLGYWGLGRNCNFGIKLSF